MLFDISQLFRSGHSVNTEGLSLQCALHRAGHTATELTSVTGSDRPGSRPDALTAALAKDSMHLLSQS